MYPDMTSGNAGEILIDGLPPQMKYDIFTHACNIYFLNDWLHTNNLNISISNILVSKKKNIFVSYDTLHYCLALRILVNGGNFPD